jgi:solute:Na+ symporter, SSS family
MQAITHLNFVDWLIIAIYFIFVLGIGVFVRESTKNSNDFFMAGRRNSSWISGLAFLSANMGALELLGMAGQSYQYGILTAHFYLIGAIPAMLFLAIYMMPFYYSKKILSIPGYLKCRFNESTRTLNAFAFAIMTLLMSGINMYAMALVLNVFVGWNFNISILVSAITIACYVGLGGLTSAIFSEVLQFFLIWFGLFLAVILGLIHVGGWHEIVARLPASYSHLWMHTAHATQNPMSVSWVGIVFGLGFVLAYGYWTTDFLVIQRAFSAKDLRSAQMAPVIASFFKMALPIMVVVLGLIALMLVRSHAIHDIGSPDNALLYVLNAEYPHGLLGLGVTALLAGFMSGQAGNISAFNTVFTYDLYKSHVVKNASDHHYLTMGRVMTVVGVLISVVTAYWAKGMPSIMSYMQALFSIVNAPLFAVILLGMFWKRINGVGAFWGLFFGMSIAAAMFLLVKFHKLPVQDFAFSSHASPMAADFWRAIWAWLIASVVTVVLSLLTKKPNKTQLEGFVYRSSAESATALNLAWYMKPRVWASVSLLIFVLLNIWFW